MLPGCPVWSIQCGESPTLKNRQVGEYSHLHDLRLVHCFLLEFWALLFIFNSEWHRSLQPCIWWFTFARLAMATHLNESSEFIRYDPLSGSRQEQTVQLSLSRAPFSWGPFYTDDPELRGSKRRSDGSAYFPLSATFPAFDLILFFFFFHFCFVT